MREIQDFEYIILKNLTHNSEYFGKIMPILETKYLTEVGSRELFKLIKTYYAEYQGIPSLTELVAMVRSVPNSTVREEVINTLKEVNKKDLIDNVDFLCNETVSWVRDALYLEALQVGSEGLMEKNDEKKLKAQELLDARAKISIDSDLGLDFDDIETMIEYYKEAKIGILTQHEELNRRLGPGFMPKTLSVLLAGQGIGKSLLMTDLISGMIKKGQNVLLISMEMQDKEIMKRVHANAMDLPINSLIDLSKTEGELNKIRQGYGNVPGREIVTEDMVVSAYNRLKMEGKVGKLFVKDYPSGAFSALQLEQLVESYKIEKGIKFDAVFLDYLGIMKSDRLAPSVGLYSYIKAIGEEVRASAHKLDLAIISASQLNRGSLQGDVAEADNANIADSMGTAMTADFMLFLLQDEEMKSRGEIILKCTKNRFTGMTDLWLMNIDYTRMRFNDMVHETMTDGEISSAVGLDLDEDFGIITAKKMESATEFANTEVKDIMRESAEQLFAKPEEQTDEQKSEIEQIYADLGI